MGIKTKQEKKIDELSSYIGKLVYVKSLKTKLEIVDLEIEENCHAKNTYWFRVRVPGRDHKPTRIKTIHVIAK